MRKIGQNPEKWGPRPQTKWGTKFAREGGGGKRKGSVRSARQSWSLFRSLLHPPPCLVQQTPWSIKCHLFRPQLLLPKCLLDTWIVCAFLGGLYIIQEVQMALVCPNKGNFEEVYVYVRTYFSMQGSEIRMGCVVTAHRVVVGGWNPHHLPGHPSGLAPH